MEELQIGVARYAPGSSASNVEVAVVVADDWHGRGVSRMLLHFLFVAAKDVGVARMEGAVLSENSNMLRFCRELGFTVSQYPGDANLVRVERNL